MYGRRKYSDSRCAGYPSRKFYQKAGRALVQRYPQLADNCGSGHDSWVLLIRQKIQKRTDKDGFRPHSSKQAEIWKYIKEAESIWRYVGCIAQERPSWLNLGAMLTFNW
ncbi:hypothetical protein V5799_014909 [Amblyomma americanum]|uniref:Uncharacterized protein n=1 Tax=Amblyomma americanum TaxID=6943 RepID=A0AAQ4E1N8_AMBAM